MNEKHEPDCRCEPCLTRRLAADPKIQDLLRRLAPKVGGQLTSVTFSSNIPGLGPVTLTQADRARMDAAARKRRKA